MARSVQSRRFRLKLVLFRDQNGKCFFCGLRMHEDVTLEHLLAQTHGGGDSLRNCRVAHGKCNVLVGILPVDVKMRLHHIGHTLGSDAFFQEVNALRPRTRKRNPSLSGKKKRKQFVMADGKMIIKRGGLTMTVEPIPMKEQMAKIAAHERRLHQRLNAPVPPSVKRPSRTAAEAPLEQVRAGVATAAPARFAASRRAFKKLGTLLRRALHLADSPDAG